MCFCCLFLVSLRVFIYFSLASVAELPPFGKKLLTRLTMFSLFILLTICNIRYFRFRCRGLALGSDCFSSLSLHTSYF